MVRLDRLASLAWTRRDGVIHAMPGNPGTVTVVALGNQLSIPDSPLTGAEARTDRAGRPGTAAILLVAAGDHPHRPARPR